MGDTSGLGFALVARHWSLWGPHNVRSASQAANDLLGLAQRSGDERLAIQGHRWRMIDLLELGEIDAVDVEIDAYAQIATRRRRVGDALYVHIYRAMRCLLAGDFDRADEESREALRLGERLQDPNAGSATLLQAFVLRRERGGLERIEGAIRHYAESYATIPGWYCVLSLLHAESGRPTRPARRSTASPATSSAACRSTASGSGRSPTWPRRPPCSATPRTPRRSTSCSSRTPTATSRSAGRRPATARPRATSGCWPTCSGGASRRSPTSRSRSP